MRALAGVRAWALTSSHPVISMLHIKKKKRKETPNPSPAARQMKSIPEVTLVNTELAFAADRNFFFLYIYISQ